MEITSDIKLKGNEWAKVIECYKDIFQTRTHYQLFILCVAIGIMYDQRIANPICDADEEKLVPRNVLQNNDNGILDYMFQAAVLTTKTMQIEEEERLQHAFGDNVEINKISFLLEFSNYGAHILTRHIGSSVLETMDNLKDFLASSVEGRNFDINGLEDDVILEY